MADDNPPTDEELRELVEEYRHLNASIENFASE